jgi:undecaprenyl-diphosphatase
MQHLRSLRLQITVGVIILVIAGSLFGLIAENVVSGGGLTVIDVELAQWLHARSRPLLTQCLLILTNLHDPWVISPVAALIAVAFIWKKSWYAALAVLFGIEGGMLLNLLAKQAFHRARPSFENPLLTLTTYSFPSGHVVASTVFYGVLAALWISQTPSWARTFYTMLAALLMIVLVAFSRMYLGAHYLSDVLAAFLEAVAWLALCFAAMQSYRFISQRI